MNGFKIASILCFIKPVACVKTKKEETSDCVIAREIYGNLFKKIHNETVIFVILNNVLTISINYLNLVFMNVFISSTLVNSKL